MILSSLNARGVISLKDMAAELGVAEITVRRDIEKLELEGRLKRVQGGAASLEESDGAELTMRQKTSIHAGEKEIVAKYAAGLVQDGDSVFLDVGTTIVPLAAALLQRRINIIANSPRVTTWLGFKYPSAVPLMMPLLTAQIHAFLAASVVIRRLSA